MENKYHVPMVLKTFRILESFGELGQELSLTEIMRKSKVAKASAFRILQTLQHTGYVEKNPARGNYRLGIKILQLGCVVDRRAELKELALPFLLALQQRFNETANLAILDQGDVLYLATVESTSTLRISRGEQVRQSIHSTALGKALTAFLPWERVDAILRSKGMPRKTVNTIVTCAAFKRELEKVRLRGVAFDIEELEIGGWCVGAPVFDFTGEVAAAFSIAAPLTRVQGRHEDLADAVKEVARKMSEKLGSQTPESAVPEVGRKKSFTQTTRQASRS